MREKLAALVFEIEAVGPVRGNWKNYGKLSDIRHHCHLKSGHPTYVVCWEITDKKVQIMEVYYVGTHEKAPVETIFVGKVRFQVSKEKANAVLTLLKGTDAISAKNDDEGFIPSSEIFKEEIGKYTNPGLALRSAPQRGAESG